MDINNVYYKKNNFSFFYYFIYLTEWGIILKF